jgi:hypothetical protein
MLKKAGLLSLIGFAFAAPNTAMANNFSYNFLEVRTAISPESFGGEFSTHFTDNSHFILRADTRFDEDWDMAGGIGFNGPINQFMDIYGQMLLHHVNYTKEEGDDSEFIYELNIGGRVWLTNQLEVHAKIGRADESGVFIGGVRFHSTDQLSLSAEARNAGIWGPQIAMGVRFNY